MKIQNKIISFISQWKVIIPLAAIVLAWFFWPQINPAKVKTLSATQTTPSKNGQNKQDVEVISLFGTKKKLRCTIESATAIVDDTKIVATLNKNGKQSRYIFDGDCLYQWTNGSGGGDRSCGLKSYIPLVSQFVSNDSLQKIFPQTNELASACKDVTEVDQKVFTIPKTILFKNKKLF